jgi:hypothetical protein
MNIQIPSAYRWSIRTAEAFQVLVLLLIWCVDGASGISVAVTFAAWILFWIGVFVVIRFREKPSTLELVALGIGLLAIMAAFMAASG